MTKIKIALSVITLFVIVVSIVFIKMSYDLKDYSSVTYEEESKNVNFYNGIVLSCNYSGRWAV